LLGFQDAPAITLSSIVYRIVGSGVDPLSTLGSKLNGGRYNAPGVDGVLYASLEKATAVAEITKGLTARGINPDAFGPRDWWLYEIELDVNKVLDLTDPKVLAHLQINADSIIGDDVHLTRQIGKQAIDAGFQAILAPSATHHGKNVVILLRPSAPAPNVKSSAPISISPLVLK
jgi:RES domain-containing protein